MDFSPALKKIISVVLIPKINEVFSKHGDIRIIDVKCSKEKVPNNFLIEVYFNESFDITDTLTLTLVCRIITFMINNISPYIMGTNTYYGFIKYIIQEKTIHISHFYSGLQSDSSLKEDLILLDNLLSDSPS